MRNYPPVNLKSGNICRDLIAIDSPPFGHIRSLREGARVCVMLRAVVVGAVLAASVPLSARAQLVIPGLFDIQPTAGQQRAQIRPFILGLTNCVARRALEDDAAVLAFRDDGFTPYVRTLIEQCPRFENELSQAYDQTYGPGQGQVFIDGAYARDLPRAVLARIRPQLQAKLDTLRKDEAAAADRAAQEKIAAEAQARQAEADRQREAAEQADRDARARAEEATRERQAEAERQRTAAEAEQQAATARADAEKAKAQERAAAQVAEAERLKQVALATSTAKLLAVKALDCSREQLRSLVKSGESAEVLANAVMTICGSDVDHFIEAGAKEFQIEHEVRDDDVSIGLAKEKMKAETREHVVALAVQAKAGVGGFAPANSN